MARDAEGLGARFALFVAFLSALAAIFVSRIRPDLWQRIPFFTAAMVAWSVGVTLAYGSALGAMRSDADEGVLFLARTRGIGASEHAFGRVVGLTALLALSVAGSTLVAGMAATSVSPAPLKLPSKRPAPLWFMPSRSRRSSAPSP